MSIESARLTVTITKVDDEDWRLTLDWPAGVRVPALGETISFDEPDIAVWFRVVSVHWAIEKTDVIGVILKVKLAGQRKD